MFVVVEIEKWYKKGYINKDRQEEKEVKKTNERKKKLYKNRIKALKHANENEWIFTIKSK